MSDLAKRLRIKAGMIEMGERIAWGSDSALMREAADALDHAAVERKKVGRPQIREVFLRNGARIEPDRDDLPDWVYESVFELLDSVIQQAGPAIQYVAPAVQGELVAWATRLYNTAYHAGHHDTVEGGYTHVYPQDMDIHHEDVVQEWLADNPQPAEQKPFEWPLLDAPALIGGVVVGKGCSTGTVVAIAKRKHQYEVETSPEEHARREKAFKDMLRQIHEGIGQQPAEQQPALIKYQPCGCVICTCEHETQCQGCGAKHCGTHLVGQIPGPAYQQAAPDVAGLVEELEAARQFIVNGIEVGAVRMPDSDTPDPAHNTLPMIDAALAAHRKQGGDHV